jgi:hypothetical protein
MTAATDFAMAISRLARKAMSTVNRLWFTCFGCLLSSAITSAPATYRPYLGRQ